MAQEQSIRRKVKTKKASSATEDEVRKLASQKPVSKSIDDVIPDIKVTTKNTTETKVPPPEPPKDIPKSPVSKGQKQSTEKPSSNDIASKLQARRSQPVRTEPETSRPVPKRRPAGPARARIAANDDRPSIGGLIFSLQQKPSNRPYKIALIASIVWAFLGLLLAWAIIGSEISRYQTIWGAITSPQTIAILATIIIPIVLFWFLALLVLRAQELRLMSSAMTEVAVRLAEPDRMAEQQVASLGQTVRRQVAAMNDAIGRALGRAGELEALVHNEVAALERSYSENELRIRSLIDELASEREALTNNSERVSDALNNIGLRVAQDLSKSGERVTKALTAATNSLSDNLATKGEKVTSAIAAAGKAIDDKLTDHGTKITQQIVTQGAEAAKKIQEAGDKVNTALQESTDRTTALVTSRGNSLLTALSSMNDRIRNELPGLLESLGGEQVRLSKIIESAVKNLAELELSIVNRTGALEKTLGDRTQHLQSVLSQHLKSVDQAVIERANSLDTAMLERTKALDAAFTQRVEQINSALEDQAVFLQNTLQDRSKSIENTLASQAASFDDTFMRGVSAFRNTTDNLTQESIRTIEALAGQADVLKNVSEGLLNQVNSLTHQFENRGQSIVTAAHSLENSQFKIDAILENRQVELNSLIDNISTKTGELDSMMRNYSSRLERSISDAQRRASEISKTITNDSTTSSQNMVSELEKLRKEAQTQTEQAVAEMRNRFVSITSEVSDHIGTLSSNFSNTTEQIKERTQMAAGQIDATQSEIRRKLDELPELTRESATAMRTALHDQLQAIDSLSSIAAEHNRARDVSRPINNTQTVEKNASIAQATNGYGQDSLPAISQQSNLHSTQATQPIKRHDAGQSTNIPKGIQRQMVPPSAGQQPSANMASPSLRGDPNSNSWSMGDLLQRASTDNQKASSNSVSTKTQQPPQSRAIKNATLDMHVIARAIDQRVAANLWQRYQAGERGIFNRALYTSDGQNTFDEVYNRYISDNDFMMTVDSYLNDFERLLREADQKDPQGQLVQNYLTSETGRVYLLLAHASGRLG